MGHNDVHALDAITNDVLKFRNLSNLKIHALQFASLIII